jgi:hypothetical protein
MIYILIEGNFYKVYTDKIAVLKAYSQNRQAKIYTKKLILRGKN